MWTIPMWASVISSASIPIPMPLKLSTHAASATRWRQPSARSSRWQCATRCKTTKPIIECACYSMSNACNAMVPSKHFTPHAVQSHPHVRRLWNRTLPRVIHATINAKDQPFYHDAMSTQAVHSVKNCLMRPVWVTPTSSRQQPNPSRASLRRHLPPTQLLKEHGLPPLHLVNCSLTLLTLIPCHNAFFILIYINAANKEIKLSWVRVNS